MYLSAYVVYRGEKEPSVITSTDYATKSAFKKELEANGFIVRRISNNQDLHIAEHYDYQNVAELKREMKYYEEMNLTNFTEYKRLREILEEVKAIPL